MITEKEYYFFKSLIPELQQSYIVKDKGRRNSIDFYENKPQKIDMITHYCWYGTIIESIDSYSSIYNLFGDNFLEWLTDETEPKTVQQYIKFYDEHGGINK